MQKNNTIHIAASIILNNKQEMLLVRKQSSRYYMQAGGKIEQGESAIEALVRELQEELNYIANRNHIHYIGEFSAPAANEPNHNVHAHLFLLKVQELTVSANAELEEVSWFPISKVKSLTLAPLTRNTILPIVEKIVAENDI